MFFWLSYTAAIQDGKLRAFKWPAKEATLDKANAHSDVKDIDFMFHVIPI